MLRPNDFVIGGHNWQQHAVAPVIDGEHKARGLVPRPFAAHPVGSYPGIEAFDMPTIPRDEWAARIQEAEANKAQLSHVRRSSGPNGGHIPALDQGSVGYCWNHSTTMAIMLNRARANQPYVRLSAFMIGCLVKNYRDEGGWGAASLAFATENGVPDVKFWPEKSMKRANDTPEMRANAKLHMPTEAWADLQAAEYDRNLTEDQAMTVLLLHFPLVSDFNWWSHSVCVMDAVLNLRPTELTTARGRAMLSTDLNSLDLNDPKDAAVMADVFGKRGINSWTDQYGDLGEFVLTGTKAHLDGGVAPRVVLPSDA
jgi:hypothetical protein